MTKKKMKEVIRLTRVAMASKDAAMGFQKGEISRLVRLNNEKQEEIDELDATSTENLEITTDVFASVQAAKGEIEDLKEIIKTLNGNLYKVRSELTIKNMRVEVLEKLAKDKMETYKEMVAQYNKELEDCVEGGGI